MGIFGYLLVALIVIAGLAITYKLRGRRHPGLSDESPEGRQASARRDEQFKRSEGGGYG